MKRFGSLALALLVAAAVLLPSVGALTPIDEASFYVSPWEQPVMVNITLGVSYYFFVMANQTNQTTYVPLLPLVLFRSNGNDSFTPIYDLATLNSVLAVVRPQIHPWTNESEDQVALTLSLAQTIQDAAQARQDYLLRSQQFAAFQLGWAYLSASYSQYRGLKLPAMDTLITKMNESLTNMGLAQSSSAAQTYAYTFDDYYYQAIVLYDNYQGVYPDYSAAVLGIQNASNLISESVRGQFVSSEQTTQDSRNLEALWATVNSAETMLIEGYGLNEYAKPMLDSVAENATAIGSDAVAVPSPPDYTWAYVTLVLFALFVIVAGVYFYRSKSDKAINPYYETPPEPKDISGQLEKVFSKLREIDKL